MKLSPEVEQIINKNYRIIDTLGSGGIGTTYKAQKIKTQENVALKIVSLKDHRNWKTIELFEREAEVLKTIDHPGIPKYLDYFEVETADDKLFCIVQQLAGGKSLAKWVEEGWRSDEKEVKKIAKEILQILHYLHSQKPPIIHRDIKPQNIIRAEDGKIFLVDFGAVQNTYYTTLRGGSTVVGTYGYMAPEHFRAVPATDLYSLGATILFLLLHRPPSELPRDEYDNLKIDFRSYVQVSDGFADWLDKMLEPTLEERFSSAQESLKFLRTSKPFRSKISPFQKRNIWLNFGLIGLTIFSLFNYKWFILSRLGFQPLKLCSNEQLTINYLKQGGKIAKITNLDQQIKYIQQNRYYLEKRDSLENCLKLALSAKNIELFKLLVNRKINVDDAQYIYQYLAQFYWTDFRYCNYYNAPDSSYIKYFESLLNQKKVKVDVNASIDNQQNTLLHSVTYCLSSERIREDTRVSNQLLAQLLLENGADIKQINDLRESPLNIAQNSKYRKKELIELLTLKANK